MKYCKPDYEKVRLNIADSFASYGLPGCIEDELGHYSYTGDGCEDTWVSDGVTYTEMGWGSTCYSTPPNV